MNDGTPVQYILAVRALLNSDYGQYWIGRGGPVPALPPPALNPIGFYVWGYLKSLVHSRAIDDDVRQLILDGAKMTRHQLGIFHYLFILFVLYVFSNLSTCQVSTISIKLFLLNRLKC